MHTAVDDFSAGKQPDDWPRFEDIAEPRMVSLYTGNGSGTKLFQGFLDGHPQILMVPGYPLMYLYPHWDQWRKERAGSWSWPTIVDLLCEKHASILDTRNIPGHDGLTKLGESQNQSLQIDSALFRSFLLHLLDGQKIESRTFVLAVHYAYGYCRGEDLSRKKVLVYHIHVPSYVPRYVARDFPDMLTLGFVRDPRSNLKGRYERSSVAVDAGKLNDTDARIYLRRTYCFLSTESFDGLEVLRGLAADTARVVRHEDLHYRPEDTVNEAMDFMGIDYDEAQKECTFGGLPWWGDPIYNVGPTNKANPRIVSLEWQQWLPALDWFVIEGLCYDYCRRYGYELYKFKHDSFLNRLLLFFAIFLPTAIERRVFADYLKPSTIGQFLQAAVNEGFGRTPLKEYGTNAYYRHKWSNKGLRLWQPRWYTRLLRATQSRQSGLIRWSGSTVYVAANLARYGIGIFIVPYWVVRRWGVFFGSFTRLLHKTSVLPQTLPANLPVGKS